ncbi:MAG: hypothetical protein KDL31_13055, partial [Kiritimatiellae bacterium]|nr:hypothetical protein [Kiritimatiellia bacterium]
VSPFGKSVFPYTRWSDAATNIQDAVDAAAIGELVLVTNGTYTTGGRVTPGYLTTNRVVIDKDITVKSVNGRDVTIIKGAKNGDTLQSIRCVYMSTGSLSGFTLTDGFAPFVVPTVPAQRDGGGVFATGGTVEDCLIEHNYASAYGGGAAGGHFVNCEFSGNEAADGGGGAYASTLDRSLISFNASQNGGGASDCIVNNSVIIFNTATEIAAGAYGGTLNNCTVIWNTADVGASGVFGVTANNSIIYNNSGTNYPNHAFSTINNSCTTPDPGAGTGNITASPAFVSLLSYKIGSNSPCRDAGNNALAVGDKDVEGGRRIVGALVDMGAYEVNPPNPIHYVSQNGGDVYPYLTWADAATNIQDAVNTPGATHVFVSNGTYNTGLVMTPGYQSYNRLVIDNGVIVQSMNGPSVTTITGGSSTRCVYVTSGVLSGFTLRDGESYSTTGPQSQNKDGACVYAVGGVLSNCVIRGGSTDANGGGVYGGTLYDCILRDNFTIGLGGGAYSSVLERCTLYDNNGLSAGGGAYGGQLKNCLVYDNSASFGGGAGAFGSELYNCTIVDNTGGSKGGFTPDAAAGVRYCTVQNSIVYSNRSSQGLGYVDHNYDNSTFSYSCSTPLPAGTGNIVGPPQFLSASDYRQTAGSPGVDTGNNADAAGAYDLDRSPRIANGTVDMGAYEYFIQPSTGYWAWAASIQNGMTNPADNATGDGYPNLLKYATGSSPTNADLLAHLSSVAMNGVRVLTFYRNVDATDVTLIVEASDSMADDAVWTGIATNTGGSWGGNTNVTELSITPPASVALTDPVTGATNRYNRLRVTQP